MSDSSAPARTNTKTILTARPSGIPDESCFEIVEEPVAAPAAGQVVVRNEYLSVDPAMRGWVSAVANYSEPVPIGAVMRSFAAGEVVESQHPDYPVGTKVMGMLGWQQYATVGADAIWRKVTEDDLPLSLSLGVLGLNGLTAWAGVREVLRPESGQSVVVSTAAGAVGSLVGQLCKAIGCRTVGITGSAEKVALCVDEFGFDAAVDYRSSTFVDDLAAALPDGVDRYFDNTAGSITDAVLEHLNTHAAMVVCGTASISSWDPWPTGPRIERRILTTRARVEGLLAFDFMDRLQEAVADLAGMVRAGELTYREDVLEGMSSAPGAIAGLYRGENLGRRVIRL
ncbi:NADP-dependent oxidoreductase [Blastococcus sp. Marseille-P5729]|uniref:NADP-dependent oxidoreductase n=1 Tax=Blastococcus sp. Marseille-P5729 TaxID=2086582 RepID=UPI000D10328D|nr:NADP-dependent oxidoreductase [Blastococcus sp. Marseille-P5729]